MAKEALYIPEERLSEAIAIIRAGLEQVKNNEVSSIVTDETIEQLAKWCDEEEKYLESLRGGTYGNP